MTLSANQFFLIYWNNSTFNGQKPNRGTVKDQAWSWRQQKFSYPETSEFFPVIALAPEVSHLQNFSLKKKYGIQMVFARAAIYKVTVWIDWVYFLTFNNLPDSWVEHNDEFSLSNHFVFRVCPSQFRYVLPKIVYSP